MPTPKTHSVYVPPEQGETLESAHRAWLRFQELGAEVSAANREQFLRALKREKGAGQVEAGQGEVIELCRRQRSFAEGRIAEKVGELWQTLMYDVDALTAAQADA